jgi:hypothetical protein
MHQCISCNPPFISGACDAVANKYELPVDRIGGDAGAKGWILCLQRSMRTAGLLPFIARFSASVGHQQMAHV